MNLEGFLLQLEKEGDVELGRLLKESSRQLARQYQTNLVNLWNQQQKWIDQIIGSELISDEIGVKLKKKLKNSQSVINKRKFELIEEFITSLIDSIGDRFNYDQKINVTSAFIKDNLHVIQKHKGHLQINKQLKINDLDVNLPYHVSVTQELNEIGIEYRTERMKIVQTLEQIIKKRKYQIIQNIQSEIWNQPTPKEKNWLELMRERILEARS